MLTLQTFLLPFTFVFGVIQLITWLNIFQKVIDGSIETLSFIKLNWFFKYIDILIFIFSLMYQSWYWLFR